MVAVRGLNSREGVNRCARVIISICVPAHEMLSVVSCRGVESLAKENNNIIRWSKISPHLVVFTCPWKDVHLDIPSLNANISTPISYGYFSGILGFFNILINWSLKNLDILRNMWDCNFKGPSRPVFPFKFTGHPVSRKEGEKIQLSQPMGLDLRKSIWTVCPVIVMFWSWAKMIKAFAISHSKVKLQSALKVDWNCVI